MSKDLGRVGAGERGDRGDSKWMGKCGCNSSRAPVVKIVPCVLVVVCGNVG